MKNFYLDKSVCTKSYERDQHHTSRPPLLSSDLCPSKTVDSLSVGMGRRLSIGTPISLHPTESSSNTLFYRSRTTNQPILPVLSCSSSPTDGPKTEQNYLSLPRWVTPSSWSYSIYTFKLKSVQFKIHGHPISFFESFDITSLKI